MVSCVSFPFFSLFHRVADFIKGFANRITIVTSKYYAEYSIVIFNLLLRQNNIFGKSLMKVGGSFLSYIIYTFGIFKWT